MREIAIGMALFFILYLLRILVPLSIFLPFFGKAFMTEPFLHEVFLALLLQDAVDLLLVLLGCGRDEGDLSRTQS